MVFGGASVGASGVIDLSDLDGANGFVLNGVTSSDYSGYAVSAAGDLNADGVADLLIGAYQADPNSQSGAGEGYVVFGGPSVGASGVIELSDLNGVNGFVLNGVTSGDLSGVAVSAAGDLNADGVADLLIGAQNAAPNSQSLAGESYAVFGGPSVGASGVVDLSDLNGANGFVLNGVTSGDRSGVAVSAAGDLNADGVADLLIGARYAAPNSQNSAGASYVVFGGASVGGSGVIELSNLNGTNGFVLDGVTSGDQSGRAVSAAGDINGDGVSDLLIAAYQADPDGRNLAGESYVVFGRIPPPTLLSNQLTLNEGDTFPLSQANLNATDSHYENALLTFDFTDIEYGQFEWVSAPGTSITSIYQQNIRPKRCNLCMMAVSWLLSTT